MFLLDTNIWLERLIDGHAEYVPLNDLWNQCWHKDYDSNSPNRGWRP